MADHISIDEAAWVIFAQRGMPWLPTDEEQTLLDYLTAHAGTS